MYISTFKLLKQPLFFFPLPSDCFPLLSYWLTDDNHVGQQGGPDVQASMQGFLPAVQKALFLHLTQQQQQPPQQQQQQFQPLQHQPPQQQQQFQQQAEPPRPEGQGGGLASRDRGMDVLSLLDMLCVSPIGPVRWFCEAYIDLFQERFFLFYSFFSFFCTLDICKDLSSCVV